MSADNYIAIQKRKKKWWVWMDWASSAKKKPSGFYLKKFDTRDEAIDYAAKVCREEIVEYGIQMLFPKEKK